MPDLKSHIDHGHALQLLRGAIGTPSVTGSEAAFARFVEDELWGLGAEPVAVEEFAPGRSNAWGVFKGTGGADATGAPPRSLMFLGHLDTVHVRGWAEHWRGTEREDPFGAAVVDGAVWGRGAVDLKGGICAFLAALHTLKRAGIRLRGDVVGLFCGDEESGEPGSGVSAGIKAIVPRIQAGELPRADFAIYVEPTRLQVFAAQMGFFVAEIELSGLSAYFGVPEQGVDALRAGHAVLDALWRHDAELARQPAHPLVGRAFLLVTELASGGYIAVPGRCRISLIRKLLPGDDLGRAREALEAAIHGAMIDPRVALRIDYPAGRDHEIGGTPCETPIAADGVALLAQAAAQAMLGRGAIEGAPYWSEAPFTMQLGMPTVYCAPGDIACCHTFDEHLPLAEYHAAIEAYALMMVRYCGVAEHPQGDCP